MTNGRLIDPFPEPEDSAGDLYIDAGSDILESPSVDDIKEKIQNDTFIHTEYENYDVRTHLEKTESRWTSIFAVSRNGRKLEDGEFTESPFRQSPEESKSEKGTVSPDWEETYLVQAAVKHQELCRRVVAHIKSEKEAIKKKKRKKWIIATAACLLIAIFACIAIYKNRQQSVKNIKLDVTFQFQKPGETPSLPYPVDSPEISNITLTHKDNYWLNITSGMDGGNLFLYIFQMDQLKKVNILFPNLNYGQVTNPISGPKEFKIPSNEDNLEENRNRGLYLSELLNDSTIVETIYIVASTKEADDVLDIFGEIQRMDHTPKEHNELLQEFLEELEKRKNSDSKSIYYKEFKFMHAMK